MKDLPIENAVESIDKFSKEYEIHFLSARNFPEAWDITKQWLDKWGFKYSNLLMGKPRGGNYHWIDNHIVRGTRYKGQWTELTNRTVEIQVFDD